MNRSGLTWLSCSISLIVFVLTGCGGNPAGPGENDDFSVTLTVSNLERLPPDGGHYELWLSFPEEDESSGLTKVFHDDERFVSFGKFNLSTDGSQVVDLEDQAMTFRPAETIDINVAVDAIVTIQTDDGHEHEHGESDEREPGSRILGGVFTGTDTEATATLTAADEDAFDFDYAGSAAVYVLDSPTTLSTADFNSGIWWINPGSALSNRGRFDTISSGFTNLPALGDTAQWRYQGWIVHRSGIGPLFYSTGRFLSPESADLDLAGVTSGTDDSGYPFPGQDFIQSIGEIPALLALDNGSFETRITLEPEPDNSPLPFQLQVLADPQIGPTVPGSAAVQTMQNLASTSFPSATVRIRR